MVEERGGPALLDKAWASSQNVPSIDEIRAPELWISRVSTDDDLAA